jgi:hypothetical protein
MTASRHEALADQIGHAISALMAWPLSPYEIEVFRYLVLVKLELDFNSLSILRYLRKRR